MRCKNCGADNNENRYICEVCGSPLYDENSAPITENDDRAGQIAPEDDGMTRTFSAISNQQTRTPDNARRYPQQENNYSNNNQQGKGAPEPEKDDNKKNVIVIAILVVILVAVIASVVAIAHNKNSDNNSKNESELTRISSTMQSQTTKPTTEKETTTEATTTTQTTTEATKTMWIINTSSSGGGDTSGGGEYSNGEKVTLVAIADDGYVFDGWYSNGIKVSSNAEYTFKANENASFSAVFNPVETQPTVDLPSDEEVVFGE